MSTFESELIALYQGIQELLQAIFIMNELGFRCKSTCFCDNEAVVKSLIDEYHPRTRHLGIRFYKIKELIEQDVLTVKWISTTENLADCLTKALPSSRFDVLTSFLMNDNT